MHSPGPPANAWLASLVCPVVLEGELKEDRTGAWSAVLSAQSDLVKRDLTLEIEPEGKGSVLRIYPSDQLGAKFPERTVPLRLTGPQLFCDPMPTAAVSGSISTKFGSPR